MKLIKDLFQQNRLEHTGAVVAGAHAMKLNKLHFSKVRETMNTEIEHGLINLHSMLKSKE